jgi:hypothetical protein
MQTQPLAARLIAYCAANALTIGGLIDRLKTGETLCPELAQAIVTYCDEHALELAGGMLAELAEAYHGIVPVAVPGVSEACRAMGALMIEQAAVWRALKTKWTGCHVFADKDDRLLWTVPGVERVVGMQLNPNSDRPMVMAGCGFTAEQLEGARVVVNVYRDGQPPQFKAVGWCAYCELHAKGCDSAAEFILRHPEVVDV